MVQASLNIFDLIVIGIIGLSGLLSFFRGFAREVLSLGAWLGAGVITLYAFPHVAEWLEPQVKNVAVANGLASIGLFVTSLILISILTGTLVKFIKPGSEVGFLDNIVGLLFGVARGVLVVSIGYFIMTLVMNEKDYPEWLEGAITRPYVAQAANWVARMTPSYLDTVAGDDAEKSKDVVRKASKKVVTRTDGAERDADIVTDDMKDSIPSFEELQQRIKAENEGR